MPGIAAAQPRTGHSAIVHLRVEAAGISYRLCEAGRNFIVVDEDANLPKMEADLVLVIDGHEHRQKIFLPDGLRRGENFIEAAKAKNA